MLPKALYSSYEQYKTDSNYVANWLATTARRCGHSGVETTPAAAPKSARLKGKARKLARETGAVPTAANGSQQPKYCVKIKDFVPLAESIAKSTRPRVEVPKAFTYRLRQAIQQRKFLRMWYRAQETALGSGDIDDGHDHFIGVLEQAAEILRPNEAADDKADAPKVETTAEFANMFAGLHVEEPDEYTEKEQRDSIRTVADVGMFTSELCTNKQESLLALMFLYIDVHRARKLLQSLWSSYRQGGLDLAAVAITTNTAIDFIRSLEDDFNVAFAGSGYDSLKGRLCLYCAYQRDADNAGATSVDFPYEPCLMFVEKITANPLRDFVKDHSDYVPSVAVQNTAIYDIPGDWASMKPQERFIQQFKLAMGMIPEYLVLTRDPGSVEGEHGIMRGLRELKQRRSPLLWLDFALQVLLDARHVMERTWVWHLPIFVRVLK